MRVLVYCPLAASMPRLYAKTNVALFELEWPEPYELLYGVSLGATDAEADLASKLASARQIALDGGFDAILIVGHDVQVPSDVLLRMAESDADRVYAVVPEAQWPYTWHTDDHMDCTLLRRSALEDKPGDSITSACIEDLYCNRLSMENGGKMIRPDPDEPDRVQIHYMMPQQAPATVPYTRTILQREPA